MSSTTDRARRAALDGEDGTPVLELSGVSKQYHQGDETIDALCETDLSIRPGEFVGVLGPSGSGKSTLLTIMGGLRTPSTGRIHLAGREITGLPEKERARLRHREMGFVLQNAGLVPYLRVTDQLILHDKVEHAASDDSRRLGLLEALGIADYRDKYPEELSGGERQRVAIAAALYHDPAVVLADEPTAALDSGRATAVARLLAEQTHERSKAAVMVTHDERLLPVCDRVLRMSDGVLSPC
ncbi:ABC transporter ATP-binding protein [Propionibacterium australiense]|uniref:Putative hemin import ATP-binding protein HrtA n=1 Tax=Propionibacterium australiense TaxID=119981 RepID=A0A8B3FJZ7_9ACTN|nr:ABC transporter ATP-binding protein [Propionibacterium australiense]RLP06728.1 ABC transporter ATP-binding protein [Propionibacterium australiense]